MQFDHGQPPIETPRRSQHSFLSYLVLLATAGFFLALTPLIAHRIFDADELEHSHAAWSVFKGMLPYRDFFEHHTPWYYYALRPFFNCFDVETAFDSARHFLLFGRILSFALAILSVFLVTRIGRRSEDRRVGLVAGLLLVTQPFFFQKAIELRPDIVGLPFFLGSLCLLLRGLDESTASTTSGRRWFLAGGLSLGAAVMLTQKMLFVLPGALAGLGIWALAAGIRSGARSRWLSMLIFLLGIAVPAVLTWAAFAVQHAGREFVTNNFLLNAKWQHTETHMFDELLERHRRVLVLSILGVCISLFLFVRSFFRSNPRRYGELLLACILVSLSVGVLVIPSAHRQYYLMPLPIVCLFAAKALFWIVERAHRWLRPLLVGAAAFWLAVWPVRILRRDFQDRNDRQLARLRTVFETTKPTDLVMDGWAGMGVFRPHAFHYFFLHEETRAMLPPARWDAYLDALESGTIRPRLIAMDKNLAAMGPRFVTFVERNYVSRDGFFYFVREGS